jgi:pectinesterase
MLFRGLICSINAVVLGQGFIAHDLAIENTAGAAKHQAVAFMSESDQSVVYRCAIMGYQDTLYAKSNKQLYHECRIEGTVDFIFGDATAVFQKCTIVARLPLEIEKQKNTITAQGRAGPNDPSGFSFHLCEICADEDLIHAGSAVETYLGRPWKLYSRVVFMKCTMSQIVHPKGWLEWNGSTMVSDLFYGEYENKGKGADVSGRVRWPGYRVIQDNSEASNFTVHAFIQGDEWLPSTGVDYTSGL